MGRKLIIMDVSIIIVNYNTCTLLRNCLRSIYDKTNGISFEILISDNDSSDGTSEMISSEFPEVKFIENHKNLGFGAANNRALDIASGKYVFYLNSDTLFENNAIKIFFDYWELNSDKDSIGALGCNLLNSSKKVIHSCGNFPNSYKLIDEYIHAVYGVYKLSLLHMISSKSFPYSDPDETCPQKTGEVDYITGADLFMKNDISARFDERYFMYCEESDLQYSLKKSGKKRIIIDGPEIIHLKGCSAAKANDAVHIHASFSHIYNTISRIIFMKKYHHYPAVCILKILVLVLWLNPYLYKKTKKYIPQLLAI